jgi:phosphoglycerate dehydrogenase-like enzyme
MTQALIHFDLPDAHLERLVQQYPQVEWVRCTDRDKVFEYLPQTEILPMFLHGDRAMIDTAPQLKWIQAITAGVDDLPLAEVDAVYGPNAMARVFQQSDYVINLLGGGRNLFNN